MKTPPQVMSYIKNLREKGYTREEVQSAVDGLYIGLDMAADGTRDESVVQIPYVDADGNTCYRLVAVEEFEKTQGITINSSNGWSADVISIKFPDEGENT